LSSFGCVEWLAARNLWRLGRNFFLDSPFIELLPVPYLFSGKCLIQD
jgi:hypothetical protein